MTLMREGLLNIVDPARVLSADEDRAIYAQDVYREGVIPAFVVRPESVVQLQAIVALADTERWAVVPRGGAMSYTGGIVPQTERTVVIDLSDLNRVLEINQQDMTVTVEAGCSWAALYDALQPTGLRTTYWGTLSGKYATVGGSVSQNSIFWGSGQYGSAADNVLGMDVVLADGSLLSTGSGAQRNSAHFMRHFGPDLTGLFTSDCSALGVKARITLRLVPQRSQRRFISASFPDFAAQSTAMVAVSRSEMTSECFGFDPFLQGQRLRRESLATDMKALTGVMKAAGGVGNALREGARVALAGRGFIDKQDWSLHLVVEDFSEAGVQHRERRVLELLREAGGEIVENTIPKVLSAHPFGPVNNMIGPQGERWVPVHALVPHGKAQQVYDATEAVFDRHRAAILEHEIGCGYLLATIATNVFVLEPVFFWPDALNELHRASVDATHLKKIKGFAPNRAAREAVAAIREELVTTYETLGASHLQLGKAYHYQSGLRPENRALIGAIKAVLDPNGIMNPGVLGFGDIA
tara:strand:- start:25262 stop:26836 length:1575 start_codon:yes stop_codon:yes gene_type:complete